MRRRGPLRSRSAARTWSFTGGDYLQAAALPNFYFHVTTAYNILRHNGVEIGKGDFLGRRLVVSRRASASSRPPPPGASRRRPQHSGADGAHAAQHGEGRRIADDHFAGYPAKQCGTGPDEYGKPAMIPVISEAPMTISGMDNGQAENKQPVIVTGDGRDRHDIVEAHHRVGHGDGAHGFPELFRGGDFLLLGSSPMSSLTAIHMQHNAAERHEEWESAGFG